MVGSSFDVNLMSGESDKTLMKLKRAIVESLRTALDEPRIQIEELSSGEITGTVSSRSFASNTVAQNFSLIKTILEEAIPEYQRKKIDILPLSPRDQEILDEFFR